MICEIFFFFEVFVNDEDRRNVNADEWGKRKREKRERNGIWKTNNSIERMKMWRGKDQLIRSFLFSSWKRFYGFMNEVRRMKMASSRINDKTKVSSLIEMNENDLSLSRSPCVECEITHLHISMPDKNSDLKWYLLNYFVLKHDWFVLNLTMDELNHVKLNFCIYSSRTIDNVMSSRKMMMKLTDWSQQPHLNSFHS